MITGSVPRYSQDGLYNACTFFIYNVFEQKHGGLSHGAVNNYKLTFFVDLRLKRSFIRGHFVQIATLLKIDRRKGLK